MVSDQLYEGSVFALAAAREGGENADHFREVGDLMEVLEEMVRLEDTRPGGGG
ncbi:MAG: hypothetical protein ACLFQ3_09720 [Thiohalorhabdus sp.]